MKDKDQIQELFSKKLGNHEAKVNPDLWNGIASQITTGATATVGISLVTKIIISTISIAAITTAVVLFSTNSTEKEKKNIKTAEKTQKAIVLEEKEAVLVHNTTHSKIDLTQEIIERSSTSSESEQVNSIIRSVNNDSLHLISENTINQTGVLKEREEENNFSTSPEETKTTTENIEEKETQPSSTDYPLIKEKEQLVEGYSMAKMPDIFTPNNDGQNDYIFIESKGLNNFNIVVMNEQSEVVYKSSDVDFKWDGNDFYGQPAPSGNYIYFITATDRNSNPVSKYQSLRILR